MVRDILTTRSRVRRWLAFGFLIASNLVVPLAHAAETVTYYYTNQQGTPLATADASGNILTTSDYRPYGGQVLGSPAGGPGYTGHVNDPDSGLVYMQARYYDPVVGRFLGVDLNFLKAGDISTFNRFAYADENPISNIDPDGRVPIVTQMKDHSVQVQYPATFSGKGATPENIAAFKEQVAAMSGTYTVNGAETKVNFEVTAVSTKWIGGTPSKARNEITLTDGPTSGKDGASFAELGGKKAEIDVTDRFVINGVVPHEVSHLGGPDDLYNKDTRQPDPAKGDSIMNRVPGRVDSATVEGIINSPGNVHRTEH